MGEPLQLRYQCVDIDMAMTSFRQQPLRECDPTLRNWEGMKCNGRVHQDDMAISPKNRFFLRQNPFFGLKPCRPDGSVPEH